MKLVLADFGTSNWNSILSRFIASRHAGRTESGTGLSFLTSGNCENRWFFEIYIQGSKYNFLELSLRNTTGK